jgi:hypothetical protein
MPTAEESIMPVSYQRLARNQIIFREVNERVRELADEAPAGRAAYFCECGELTCTETIELTAAEYEAIRARPNTFVVVPGHEVPEVERVVRTTEAYATIEKLVPLDDVSARALLSSDDPWPPGAA